MKLRKIASLSSLLLFAASASAQVFFQGTFDQALAKAKTENKRVLVDFFSGG